VLRGMEQQRVITRLGFPLSYDKKKRLSMHYVLDCYNPEHAAIARDLCAESTKVGWQALHNLIIEVGPDQLYLWNIL